MNHTQSCIDYQKKIQDGIDAYRERWPDYCEDCGGLGGHTSYYDPSPSGVGLSPGSMAEWDACESCTCKGTCPRCGKLDVLDEDGNICASCGFDGGKTEGIPSYDGDCGCGEDVDPDAYWNARME